MLPYLQIEFRNQASPSLTPIVGTQQNILFDIILAASTYDTPTGTFQSVTYDESTGIFGIKRAGVYLVNWFVSQQTGLSPEGSNFGIVIDPSSASPEWIVGSGHVKISPTAAFAVINVTEEEALTPSGKEFSLMNVSSHDAALSKRCHVKAGLAVFCVSQDVFNKGYGHWQSSGWDKIIEPYNLNHGEALKFNQSLLNPVGITPTDSTFGEPSARVGFDTFTLINPGVYQVSWEIPIEATYSVSEVEIALEIDGSTVFSRSYGPLPIGVVSGTAIIKTDKFNTSLQLINYQPEQGDIIQIGNYANLAMHRIS